jgi:catechol 2,3-dioxygenase-like lactoylglutathione lyase family enzyme
MSRVQLALRVADLEASVEFYSKLFNATPAKRRPGYANFAITEPPLKLVLLEGQPGEETRMDHLGVEVETTDLVPAATNRLAEAGLTTRTEDNTTCCYAVQDKVCALDPARSPVVPNDMSPPIGIPKGFSTKKGPLWGMSGAKPGGFARNMDRVPACDDARAAAGRSCTARRRRISVCRGLLLATLRRRLLRTR